MEASMKAIREALVGARWERLLELASSRTWLGEDAVVAWVLWTVLVDEGRMDPDDFLHVRTDEPQDLEALWRACNLMCAPGRSVPTSLRVLMTELAAARGDTEALRENGERALKALPPRDARRLGVCLYLVDHLTRRAQDPEAVQALLRRELPAYPELLVLVRSLCRGLSLGSGVRDALRSAGEEAAVGLLDHDAGILSWRELAERPVARPLLGVAMAGRALDAYQAGYRSGKDPWPAADAPEVALAVLARVPATPVSVAGEAMLHGLRSLLEGADEPRSRAGQALDRLHEALPWSPPEPFETVALLEGALLEAHGSGSGFLDAYLSLFYLPFLGHGFARPHRGPQGRRLPALSTLGRRSHAGSRSRNGTLAAAHRALDDRVRE